ncbi:MAG: hypothetical protein M9916_04485 [Crocinitomicaceae bacterium]|nr:hypothetical protein [Crocinitomicaceae bacterium]
MKRFSKKMVLALTVSAFFGANSYAADLCVNELGSGGCYASIGDALTAAVDGDRIIVQPKSGGVPYVENITIDKSVSLLSNTEGVMWLLSGNVTVTPAVGRTVSIMHMKNMSGNIVASGASPAGARCKVNILNCELVSGYIDFNYNYFNMNIAANDLKSGYVSLRYGNVIGNIISAVNNPLTVSGYYYTGLSYTTDGVATDDTLYIVGNKITTPVNYGGWDIFLNSNSQFFYIANNFLTMTGNSYSSYPNAGIYSMLHKTSSVGTNSIYNNTCYSAQSSGNYYAVYVTSNTSGKYDVKNNIAFSNSSYNYYSFTATPTVGFSYNFGTTGTTLSGIPDDGTNNFSSTSTINTTTGQLNIGSDGFNAGYPDLAFYDLDLTRNDIGCYGGSFSQDNFFPITGAARVYFVKAPRTILQSGTLNVKAESFDR